MVEPDLVVAEIIAEFTGLDADRVVLTNQKFSKPTDKGAFVTVDLGPAQIIGVNQDFDPDTDTQISSAALQAQCNIEVTSYDETAKRLRHEIVMSFTSAAGQRKQEDNQIRIFRTSEILDLSGVDGAKSLYRYQIPVRINYVEIKETVIEPIDKFPTTEVLFNE